jgi:hypothetical protein
LISANLDLKAKGYSVLVKSIQKADDALQTNVFSADAILCFCNGTVDVGNLLSV